MAIAGYSGASLSDASALGAGTAIAPTNPAIRATMLVTVAGGAAIEINLEGSIDGTNWQKINGTTTSQPQVVVNSDANQFAFLQFRANLLAISGGTSPTVTAFIAVAPVS